MNSAVSTKVAVSVSDMARMVGLSRARFYQLISSGTFPRPDTNATTGRPFYDEEKQQRCLDIKRRNCGIDGKPVLFYAQRGVVSVPKRAKPRKPRLAQYAEIVEGVQALGLTSATAAEVHSAIAVMYKGRTAGMDEGEVIRAVFLHLKRQDSRNNVGQ